MLLDPKTVVTLMVVACALEGASMVALSRWHLRDFSELRVWAWATLMQGAGWFVMGSLRGVIPDAASVIGGQLLLGGSLALWSAVAHWFVGARFLWSTALPVLGAEAVGLGYFQVVAPDAAMRQVVLSAAHCFFMLAAVRAILRQRPRPRSHNVMAMLFAGSASVFAGRGGVFAFFPEMGNAAPLEVHPFTTISYTLFFVFAIALPLGLLLMCSERHLEARDAAQQELVRAATVDALTQVQNRAAVTAHLTDALTPTTPHPARLCAVLFVDMDNFKSINDAFGHEAGDRSLIETARRLKDAVRQNDIMASPRASVGRFGGDEFIVVLDDIPGAPAATAVAARILAAMEAPLRFEESEIDIRCSIGVSVGSSDASTAQSLLREADLALYEAKGKGKGNYVLFDGVRVAGGPKATVRVAFAPRRFSTAEDRPPVRSRAPAWMNQTVAPRSVP